MLTMKTLIIPLLLLLTLSSYSQTKPRTINSVNASIDSLKLRKETLKKEMDVTDDQIDYLSKLKLELINSARVNKLGVVRVVGGIGDLLKSIEIGKYDVLTELEIGVDVFILDENTEYYKISYKSFEGWTRKGNIISKEEEAAEIATNKKNAKKEAESRAAIEKELKNPLIAKYGSNIGLKIFKKEIWIGMTKEMTLASWGKPDNINRTVTSSVVHEQWIYSDTYLYFDNGIMKAFQDKK